MSKTTIIMGAIILFLAGLAVAWSPWNLWSIGQTNTRDDCFTVYHPTYIPPGQTAQPIDAMDASRPCEERAVRFAPSSDNKPWELEERTTVSGLATYKFNTEHMQFEQSDGRKYAFVNDRNNQPALLGFIGDTFVYITNSKNGPLSQENMVQMFNGLKK